MVELRRFERPTPSVRGKCSPAELQPRISHEGNFITLSFLVNCVYLICLPMVNCKTNPTPISVSARNNFCKFYGFECVGITPARDTYRLLRRFSPVSSPRISISREPKRCIFVLCESLSLSIREPNQLFSDLCESLRVFISASVRGKAALVLALWDFKPKAALARTGALNITHPMQHDSVFCANNITWVPGTSQCRRRVHHYDTDEYMN